MAVICSLLYRLAVERDCYTITHARAHRAIDNNLCTTAKNKKTLITNRDSRENDYEPFYSLLAVRLLLRALIRISISVAVIDTWFTCSHIASATVHSVCNNKTIGFLMNLYGIYFVLNIRAASILCCILTVYSMAHFYA